MATKQKEKNAVLAPKSNKTQPAKQKKQGVKKTQDKDPGVFKRFAGYLKDVKHELHRVVWPTKPEILNYTLVVLATLVFFGALIYIIDSLIIPLFVAFAGLR